MGHPYGFPGKCLESMWMRCSDQLGQHTQHLAGLNLGVGTNFGSLTVKLKT